MLCGTTAADSSPNNRTGSYPAAGITRGARGITPGDRNTAITVTGTAGSSAAVTVPDTAALRGNGSFTIAFAAQAAGTDPSPWPTIIAKRNTSTSTGWAVYYDQATHSLHYKRGTADTWASNPGAISSTTPHLFTVGYDAPSQTLTFTIDGHVDSRISGVTFPANTDTSPLTIGNGNSPFGGTLDEVAVYDHTLSADRASYQYEAAQHGSYAQTHSYDEADRLTDPGYTYDPLGRTTTLPANDAGGQGTLTAGSRGALTATYYATDLARSLTQNGATTTYTLDPLRRTRTTTTTGQNATTLQHYPDSTSGGSEAASWTETPGAATAWTRSIPGPDGMLAATQTSTGTVRLVLTDLHGSIAGTTDDAPYATPYPPNSESTEYGGATPSTTPTPRADVGPNHHSWLGGHQRDQDAPGDLTLMGQRLYNPATGRFLQTDPIPGGSANDYDYVNQDPVNSWDLNGRSCLCGTGSEGGEGYLPGAGGGYGTSAGEGTTGARGGGGGAAPNIKGAAGEAEAAARAQSQGYRVLRGAGTQGDRTLRTTYGYIRRYDIKATARNGREIYYVEVKTGPSAGLTAAQRRADADITRQGFQVVYIYLRPARGGGFE